MVGGLAVDFQDAQATAGDFRCADQGRDKGRLIDVAAARRGDEQAVGHDQGQRQAMQLAIGGKRS